MLEDHKIKDVWEEMKKVRATSDGKSRSKEGTLAIEKKTCSELYYWTVSHTEYHRLKKNTKLKKNRKKPEFVLKITFLSLTLSQCWFLPFGCFAVINVLV